MTFTIKLADKIISVESVFPDLKDFCKDYLIQNKSSDFHIQITEDDIHYEHGQTTELKFSPSYLESLALLRKISDILPSYRRFLMHGASISYEGQAFLFTAPSGTGKSTHIRLWKKYLGDNVKIVNGDKPFLSLDSDLSGQFHPMIYGTPWAGKERWQRNCKEPLKAICFIRRGTTNTIQKIDAEECVSLLFKQVYIPQDAVSVGQTLELLDILVRNVPFYLLTCDMSEEAVKCSFETLTGLKYPH